jgi:hypothetical protein
VDVAILNRKSKGDLAELAVAADLVRRGYRLAIPFGEDWDFDLIFSRGETLERVQVKYGQRGAGVLAVRCCSHSLTNGKVRRTKRYTAATIDWLAAYDPSNGRCYYVPASELGPGMNMLHLRVEPTRNGQEAGIRHAADYADPHPRPGLW